LAIFPKEYESLLIINLNRCGHTNGKIIKKMGSILAEEGSEP